MPSAMIIRNAYLQCVSSEHLLSSATRTPASAIKVDCGAKQLVMDGRDEIREGVRERVWSDTNLHFVGAKGYVLGTLY
jgi:hypothetical protein